MARQTSPKQGTGEFKNTGGKHRGHKEITREKTHMEQRRGKHTNTEMLTRDGRDQSERGREPKDRRRNSSPDVSAEVRIVCMINPSSSHNNNHISFLWPHRSGLHVTCGPVSSPSASRWSASSAGAAQNSCLCCLMGRVAVGAHANLPP